MTEVKTEVSICRITSGAMPRQFERVPAGAEFEFNLVLTVLEKDKDIQEDMMNLISEAIQLLMDDSLGGHGSRGYGQVDFQITKISSKTSDHYQLGEDAEVFACESFDKFLTKI